MARWVVHLFLFALSLGAFGFVPWAESGPNAPGTVTRSSRPLSREDGVPLAGLRGLRGMTIGPIENALHASRGYGSAAFGETIAECAAMGSNAVAITVFGRVNDLSGRGVDLTFEAPFAENVEHVERAVRMAHGRGLSVMLVPHLWVESQQWRAEIDPKTDAGWTAWAQSYRRFVMAWAEIAERAGVDIFSVGVELRSWVTTPRAPSFAAIIRSVRTVYRGLVTYSANWDDVDHTVILGQLDLIGINAFYPLTEKNNATFAELVAGAEVVRTRVRNLARAWNKPVLFTEIGYKTAADPAVHPWEWPDGMKDVVVDQRAQALATLALLRPLLDEPTFAGFFVWRVYADPHDASQEAEFGFSPRGKLAELVLRDAFDTGWSADGDGLFPLRRRARVPGVLASW